MQNGHFRHFNNQETFNDQPFVATNCKRNAYAVFIDIGKPNHCILKIEGLHFTLSIEKQSRQEYLRDFI